MTQFIFCNLETCIILCPTEPCSQLEILSVCDVKAHTDFDSSPLKKNKQTMVAVKEVFTCEFCLIVGQSFEGVSQGGEDTLHSAKHGAESQIKQHKEEKC